jgi:dissimilatory sulfite reductase (desulfoviridin) alpha/beta subunit
MADPAFEIVVCRGAQGRPCPYALPVDPGLPGRLEGRIAASGWPALLAARLTGGARHHHRFQLAVAGCANGCSRPHIADVGLIRACRPQVDPAACTGCGACEAACPDGAVSLADGLAVVDPAACLACGRCVAVCPTGAMSGADGWRVVAGGRLGRRPRLASELPELMSEVEALAVLGKSLAWYMSAWRPNLRFGDLLAAGGTARLLAGERP